MHRRIGNVSQQGNGRRIQRLCRALTDNHVATRVGYRVADRKPLAGARRTLRARREEGDRETRRSLHRDRCIIHVIHGKRRSRRENHRKRVRDRHIIIVSPTIGRRRPVDTNHGISTTGYIQKHGVLNEERHRKRRVVGKRGRRESKGESCDISGLAHILSSPRDGGEGVTNDLARG